MPSRLLALVFAASTLAPAAATASAPTSTTLIEIGGSRLALTDATLPTEGGPAVFSASATVTDDSPVVAWAIAAAQGKGVTLDGSTILVENGVARRRATFTGAVVTEVKIKDLDANQNKKPLQIDFKWQPESVEYSKGSGKASSKSSKPAAGWDASSFRIDGLPGAAAMLSTVSFPRITIAEGKGRTVGDLVLVFEGDDVDALHTAVKKVIRDGKLTSEEYLDLSVTLVDPASPGRTGKIAMPRCKLKSTSGRAGKGGKATVTAVFMVEAFDPAGIVLQHQ